MAEMLDFNNVKGRLGVSESTLIKMIQFNGFPMKKNAQNVYEMSLSDFSKWSTGAAASEDEVSAKVPQSMTESKFNKPKTARKKTK